MMFTFSLTPFTLWPDLIRFVTQKFDTSSSCLTYKFKTDNLGFKSIEQQRQLPLVGSVGLDHEYMWDAFKWRCFVCFFLSFKKVSFSLFQHNSEELYLPSYTGNLYAPSESTPAKMIVRFPLSEWRIYSQNLKILLAPKVLLEDLWPMITNPLPSTCPSGI